MFNNSKHKSGFTLVELLVSIGIVVVILTVIVSNQSTYTDGAALANLADEIGLSISQAQAYGIGARELAPGSSEFTASYGLVFSLLGSGTETTYLTFADRGTPRNNIYDGDWSCPIGGTSECLGKVNISRGNYIESLCAVLADATELCNVGRIDISFTRPDTEAQIRFFDTTGASVSPSGSVGSKIMLMSPKGATRSIIVYSSGQISVQ